MEIVSFERLPSTQLYLLEEIAKGRLHAPVAVIAKMQSAGIGSRQNVWVGTEGNFFASFALCIEDLPDDLPLSSASIYFSYIMKRVLNALGEDIWIKWPNDFYVDDQKVGGTITKKVKDILVCGIGINLQKSQNGFSALQSDISPHFLLEKYIFALEKYPKWKQVFSEYKIEFELSRKFSVHIENEQMSLQDARLCEDGSLQIGGKKVYSLR